MSTAKKKDKVFTGTQESHQIPLLYPFFNIITQELQCLNRKTEKKSLAL